MISRRWLRLRGAGPGALGLLADNRKEPAVADHGPRDDDWVSDTRPWHSVNCVAPCHMKYPAIFQDSVHNAVALRRDLTAHNVSTGIPAGTSHVQDDGFAGEAFDGQNFTDALRHGPNIASDLKGLGFQFADSFGEGCRRNRLRD